MLGVGLDFGSRTLGRYEIPEPVRTAPSHVLLRVLEAGVCGTDRELSRFRFGVPPAGEEILILGHEALCEVVEPGGGLSKGDVVAPLIRRSCQPACRSCARGRRDLCLTGRYTERGIVGLHGYFTEFAVDDASDLLPVPRAVADFAVLLEPLSVVEKAVQAGLAAHPGEPKIALVQGAGPIGILTTLVLLQRGLQVTVWSAEPDDDPRARLLCEAGARYTAAAPPASDLVFEATGATAPAQLAFQRLNPLGVLVLIGACDFPIEFPGVRMVVANQTVLGVVNGARQHFEQGAADLMKIDKRFLSRMVARRKWSELPGSILSVPAEPKIVHVAGT